MGWKNDKYAEQGIGLSKRNPKQSAYVYAVISFIGVILWIL